MVSKFDHHVFSGGRSRVVSICQYPIQDETNLSFTSQAQGVSLTSSLVASVWFAHLMLGTFFWAPLKCGRASDGWSLWINTENIVVHIYIPASSNVCKIIAFSGIFAGGIFFCLRTDFAFFSCCICLPVLKRRKKPTKRRKNPTKWRKKSRAQNVETETAKKTGNSEKIGNRR